MPSDINRQLKQYTYLNINRYSGNHSKKIIICLILTLLSLISRSYADVSENLQINAESLLIDRNKNIADFNGKVIVWFEDLILKTNSLRVVYKQEFQKNNIEKIIIPGRVIAEKVATHETVIADSAEYFLKRGELILKGNVIVEFRDSILKTKKLVYYTKIIKIDAPERK